MLSSLAQVIASPRTSTMRPVRGIALHTTGSGLPAKAVAAGQAPLDAAIAYYRTSFSPTYVIGWDGTIAAIYADELYKTSHVGVEHDDLAPLRSGAWRLQVSPATSLAWSRRWGSSRNPLDLVTAIGGTLPNDATIGIEMIPMTDGRTQWAPPMRPGLRFTRAQHDAARALVADIARRHHFPTGWRSSRLFGHEDLNPLRRQDAGGGWDPGRLRASPYVDMAHIAGGGLSPIVIGAIAAAAVVLLVGRR